MGGTDSVSVPANFGSGTLVDLFFEGVERHAGRPALRYFENDRWEDIRYDEVLDTVLVIARGLRAKGVERGDRVAILSENRPEWALADYGCMVAGVVDVPVYPSLTPPQIAYILNDSGARGIFACDAEQLDKIREIRSECPRLEWVVVFEDRDSSTDAEGWSAFVGSGQNGGPERDAVREDATRARPEDVATILYTSGTTGPPKGVMLTHENLYSNVRACTSVLPIDETDSSLSFLPLSHAFQRTVDYLFFNLGCSIGYARSVRTVSDDLRSIRATFVVSVPRLYEKVYAGVMEATGLKGVLVRWAEGVGAEWADVRLAGRTPGLVTRMRYSIADRLVFRKIRDAVGGRLRYFVSGGAPLAPDINRFFFSVGLVILEGYGLTETSPVTNVNSPKAFPANFRIGTVGRPVPGTEIRIADDGEVLVRGPQVMKGYFGLPEKTREVISDDGWFSTGDVGELDADGFLRITDRKKDIIVTAGGKNVAPQPIENILKTNRFVDQLVLIGDRRKFLSLLVVPSFDALTAWASANGVAARDRDSLLSNPAVHDMISAEIFGQLEDLSSYEKPKKIVLLASAFSIEDGALTPTQKVKRRVVEERYGEVIDSLYEEENEDRTIFVA